MVAERHSGGAQAKHIAGEAERAREAPEGLVQELHEYARRGAQGGAGHVQGVARLQDAPRTGAPPHLPRSARILPYYNLTYSYVF